MKRGVSLLAIPTIAVAVMACGGGGSNGKTFSNNVAFVTSTIYNANLGGLAGADAKCQDRAKVAGLPGTYKAWLSDSTTDAYCHIQALNGKKADKCGQTELPVTAGPWIRTDGMAFAPTIDKLTATPSVIYTPLIYDEYGNLTNASYNLTNTDQRGEFSTGYTACSDWTDGTSTQYLASGGSTYGTVVQWTAAWGRQCTDEVPLICMQTGSGNPLPADSATAKIVFVTSTPYNGALGGLDGADQKCRDAAASIATSNASKFKAWLSDSTNSAIDRLSSNGPWARLDGYVVARSKTDLIDGTLITSISQTELGVYVSEYTWTGTDQHGVKTADHCDNWTATSSKGQSGFAPLADAEWTQLIATNCTNPSSLYCFEDE